MVTQLDRLARSTRDLLNTLAAITGKQAGFRSLGDTWADTTTPHGRLPAGAARRTRRIWWDTRFRAGPMQMPDLTNHSLSHRSPSTPALQPGWRGCCGPFSNRGRLAGPVLGYAQRGGLVLKGKPSVLDSKLPFGY